MTNPPNKSRKKLLLAIMIPLCVILIPVIIFASLYFIGRGSLFGGRVDPDVPSSLVDDSADDGRRVVYRGVTYNYNENVVSVLFMGVDKSDINEDTGYGSNGQADCIFLAALDVQTGETCIIPISRESMVDVDLYTVDGQYIGVENTQLCLAYAYGATGKESCENVCRSVSRLFYGAPVSSYVAIDWDGVNALSNLLGGIRVTALETLKGSNFTIREGESVLLKNDALSAYIHSRGDAPDANVYRMRRQKQLLEALVGMVTGELRSNFTRLNTYYSTVRPYIVSDLSLPEMTYLAGRCVAVKAGVSIRYLDIAGRSVAGPEHSEFHPDPASVYEAVLDAFYVKEE